MTAPVIQVRDPLQEALQSSLQLFMQARARRDQRAREAWDLMPEGTTAGAAATDKQITQILKRGFGIDPSKLSPETILKPATTQGQMGELLRAGTAAIKEQPGLFESVGTTAVATMAGRPARGVTTPQGLQAETGAAQAAALRDVAVQKGALDAVKDLQAKSAAARPGTPEAEEFKTFALGQVASALPSETWARDKGALLKYVAAKEGIRVATDPANPINALLAPLGISAGDAVGAVATGIDGLLTSALSIFASATESEARKSEIWEQARAQTARTVAEAFGGRVDPTFVAAVFSGDPKASETPIGKELIRFMAAGISENLSKRITAGDPGAQAILGAIPLMRIYQNDPQGQVNVVNLYADVLKKAYENAGINMDDLFPALKRDRSWLARVLETISFGGLRLFPGTVESTERKPGAAAPPAETPAPLGRAGAAPPTPTPGLPEGGTSINLSDAEKQSFQAFLAALQSVLGEAARPEVIRPPQ